MKRWKRTLAIGIVIALTSQLYWNVFVTNFRISTSVILLPLLIMTVGSQIHTLTICLVTSAIVFLFRGGICFLQGYSVAEAMPAILPGSLYYICYGLLFKLQIRNKHVARTERVILAVFLCDFGANMMEFMIQEAWQQMPLFQMEVAKNLLLIAAVRTVFVAMGLFGERQYRALLKKEEHENRYRRLFLMTTGLKNEIYLMRKNTEEIERVMSNAYRLYESILGMELPRNLQQMSLEIARDVHEIKKDYLRIIQGIEKEIDEEYDEERMSFSDLLHILEESSYQMLAEKQVDVRLLFDCRDEFTTKEHYMLMAVLKNLVSNAIEAIESEKRQGTIRISERREQDTYFFTVEDDGPGIREKHLPNIFEMGYSTKFDEKTGNIYRGVGLCGVKNAVEEQFKGSISVESKEGKGTKFLIEIPAGTLEER